MMNTNDQNLANPIEIREEQFQEAVLKSPQPVLVVFSASWSKPCHVLDSVLQALAIDLAGKAKVAKVNADDSLDLSLWYDIQSVPTLIYFTEGKPRVRIVGTASKEAIWAKIEHFNTPT